MSFDGQFSITLAISWCSLNCICSRESPFARLELQLNPRRPRLLNSNKWHYASTEPSWQCGTVWQGTCSWLLPLNWAAQKVFHLYVSKYPAMRVRTDTSSPLLRRSPRELRCSSKEESNTHLQQPVSLHPLDFKKSISNGCFQLIQAGCFVRSC